MCALIAVDVPTGVGWVSEYAWCLANYNDRGSLSVSSGFIMCYILIVALHGRLLLRYLFLWSLITDPSNLRSSPA